MVSEVHIGNHHDGSSSMSGLSVWTSCFQAMGRGGKADRSQIEHKCFSSRSDVGSDSTKTRTTRNLVPGMPMSSLWAVGLSTDRQSLVVDSDTPYPDQTSELGGGGNTMRDESSANPRGGEKMSFTASRRSFFKASAMGTALLMTSGLGSTGQAIAQPGTATRWSTSDIPSQRGRTVIITGGNGHRLQGRSGIGYEDARALAGAGATVIIASRNAQRGSAAIEQIRQIHRDADIRFETLDLTDLSSVEAFADRVRSSHQSVDTLINNAAIMAPPQRAVTVDGFERQLATNYLGHFALTAHLLPLLRQGNAPRVVNMASLAANGGAIDFDDLQAERQYDALPVYAQSKLAQMMFAFELQRRSDAAGPESRCRSPGHQPHQPHSDQHGPRQ